MKSNIIALNSKIRMMQISEVELNKIESYTINIIVKYIFVYKSKVLIILSEYLL